MTGYLALSRSEASQIAKWKGHRATVPCDERGNQLRSSPVTLFRGRLAAADGLGVEVAEHGVGLCALDRIGDHVVDADAEVDHPEVRGRRRAVRLVEHLELASDVAVELGHVGRRDRVRGG